MIRELWMLIRSMLKEEKSRCRDCRNHFRYWKGEYHYDPYSYCPPDAEPDFYCFKCRPIREGKGMSNERIDVTLHQGSFLDKLNPDWIGNKLTESTVEVDCIEAIETTRTLGEVKE